MKSIFRNNRFTVIILIIVSCVFILEHCINKTKDKKDDAVNESKNDNNTINKISFQQFSGSEKCSGCHKNIYNDHIHTAHFRTSQPALEKNIRGSFSAGKNRFIYNSSLYVDMEKRDTGLYQVVYFKGVEKKVLKFDIIIGSGTKGQSFIYWLHNRLFQLPITYYTFADQWSNSPGFPDKVQFDRPITTRCLECHTTFTGTLTEPGREPEEFNKTQIIQGVDCEKCHGPAAKHVAFHLQNPKETIGKYVINTAKLSRQQNLDLCVLCHGGNIKKIRPSFTFTAGDTLSDYFNIDTLSTTAIKYATVDVHGNQYGLLKASKCFRMSENLTCNSCHNPHKNERGNLALFSQRCMNCHNSEHGNFCKINPSVVPSLKQNCIDCHMPAKPSQSIVLFSSGQEVPKAAIFRSHFITIYQDETKKFLRSKKNLQRSH